MASAFDRREAMAFLDVPCGGFQVVDGDQDVVELDHESAVRQIVGTRRRPPVSVAPSHFARRLVALAIPGPAPAGAPGSAKTPFTQSTSVLRSNAGSMRPISRSPRRIGRT